ncbi:MAG: hypothetical protein ACOX3H_09865 [Saccharofermentanales bacterium]|jgi:hypothetical protein
MLYHDEFFDPRILTDYLTESGNYQNERTRNRAWNSYEIYGSKSYYEFPERGVYTWETYLDYEGDILTMPYTVTEPDEPAKRDYLEMVANTVITREMSHSEKVDFMRF